MKVKSFCVDLNEGFSYAFEYLDKCVAELGSDIDLHDVTDTFYSCTVDEGDNPVFGPVIVRVVAYSHKDQS